MSRFFNSKERHEKELVKNRLRNRRDRRIARARVLKSVEEQAQKAADISALAELLAAKVIKERE